MFIRAQIREGVHSMSFFLDIFNKIVEFGFREEKHSKLFILKSVFHLEITLRMRNIIANKLIDMPMHFSRAKFW